jgi:hypothetical protein
MDNKQTSERRRTLGIILLASITLIATSPPETDYRTATAQMTAVADEIVQFSLSISEDGVDEATGLRIRVTVSVDPNLVDPNDTEHPLVARLIPDDAAVGIVQTTLFNDPLRNSVKGELVLDAWPAGCVEDEGCTLGFSVDMEASSPYHVEILAELANNHAGCLISHPSFSDGATMNVMME